MWRRIAISSVGVIGVLVVTTSPVVALSVPQAPSLAVPIVDQTSTLSEQQRQALAQQIALGRKEKDYQLGVLIIPTLGNDEYLEGYSIKVAREWGIGDKTNNGVLFLVVKNDRKMRIEVGTGLEGDLTDTKASRILNQVVRPKFKAGDYYGGISAGVTSIQKAIAKQPDSALTSTSSQSSGSILDMVEVALFFIVSGFVWLASLLARTKSWWAGGVVGGVVGAIAMAASQLHPLSVIATVIFIPLGLLLDFMVSRNYQQHKASGTLPSWWAGGGSIGGGSGGWGGGGSFGGGGFSGGGSSGSW